MVSTRGIKSKFTEGELVLCYEPDPAKTKVLYDSKVLEINVNKDENGKKFLEFLIHFQGWNPTWDRFVTEDYVLKDTAENRQLQKELAEKAQLTTAVKFCRGGNLYKRDRQKRRRKLSEKINESLEAKRSLPEAARSHESSSESSSEEDPITIPIPEGLKKLLELDYCLINQENKLVKLPIKYNVLSILEGYVKDCATKALSNTQSENEKPMRSSSSTSQNPVKSVESLRNKLNLCKEVVDGLRVYFDFTLKDLLLYQKEKEQYSRVIAHIKQELNNSDSCAATGNTNFATVKQEPSTVIKQEHDSSTTLNTSLQPSYVMSPVANDNKDSACSMVSAAIIGAGGDGDRRKSLRSHRSSVGYEFTNGVVGKTHPVLTNIKDSVSSATSVSSVDTGLRCHYVTSPAVSSSSPRQEALLSQIMSWKIIPPEAHKKSEHVLPSQIYGAIHLTRLFAIWSHIKNGLASLIIKMFQTVSITVILY
ncbi:male-specific lethal 3 isoform X2 [Lycorma delicatula]|uniref:male-specific lethal 3 isoform X2 n=1 Tax=Lycorma delicatula TaxID=130591 RepID=UPI003F518D48